MKAVTSSVKIIKSYIIEDDPSSLSLLKGFLKDFAFVDIIGEASTVKEAEELMKNNQKVELVFLDIDLHGLNALDIVKYLKPQTKILFITSHPEFAVKAFEYNTVDYIIKPLSFDRLKSALSTISGFESDERSEASTSHHYPPGKG